MVAEGYKETEIGVIPEDWEVKQIKDFSIIATGNTPPTKDINNYGAEYPWITPTDIGSKKNIFIGARSLSSQGYSKARQLPQDTVLITSIASIGKNAILKKQGSCNQQINAILPSNNHISEYVYYWFENNTSKIIGLAGQTAVLMINKTDFSNIKIPLPPLKEQEKIADILSAADEKIDAIASQIQKAETLKKGLLQKLLSEGIGHSEFKDSELGKIPESWEVVELGSFSKSISKKNKDNVITDVVSVTKYDGIVNSLEYFNKKVFSDNITTYKIIERNQFAYATIHLDEGSVGFLDIFDIAVLSPMYSVFEIDYKRVDRSYFYSLVKSHKMIKIYEHIGLGSVERRKSISFNIFKKIKIPLPPLEEQKQIAEILSTADEKLEVLRAKKENYEILKKGLLQKLLSGEVRV